MEKRAFSQDRVPPITYTADLQQLYVNLEIRKIVADI